MHTKVLARTTVADQIETLVDAVLGPKEAFSRLRTAPAALLAVLGAGACQLAVTILYYQPDMRGFGVLLSLTAATLTLFVPALCIALWLWVWGLILEDRVVWSSTLGVVCHAVFAVAAARLLWTLVESLLGVGADSVVHPVYSNLGIIAPEDDWLALRFWRTFDLLSAYQLSLLTLGMRELLPSRRLPTAAGIVLGGWGLQNLLALAIKFGVTR